MNPSIQSVTASASYPGERRAVQNARKAEDTPSETFIIHENPVQEHYVETYEIEILEGRSFQEDLETDSASFIINQSAANKLELEEPLGKDIYISKEEKSLTEPPSSGGSLDWHFCCHYP